MKRKSTKSALLTSVMSLVLCFAMLLGTTFAWFTDNASTAVNTIQAGTLDVALEMKTGTTADGTPIWVNAEGKTLSWVKAAGAPAGEQVLWEPGCTYELPTLQIRNNGNLNLKYKIVISGIQGDAELNRVIDWTINDTNLTADHPLAPGAIDILTIKGHMQESAGNEYQGKSIDNIAINVYATQLGGNWTGVSGEYDSTGNEYDKDALYSVLVSGVNRTEEKAADVNAANETTAAIALTSGTIPAGTQMFKDSDKSEALTNAAITGKLQEEIKTTGSGDSVTFDISYNYVNSDNSSTAIHGFSRPLTHTFNLSKGLSEVTVTHSGTPMTKNDTIGTLEDGQYNYNVNTGVLTIMSSTYSEFEVTYKYNFVAATGGQGYPTLAEAVNKAETGATITLLNDIIVTDKDIVACSDFYWSDPINAVIPILKDGKVFDGAGHTITVRFNDKYLICSVVNATIKNLKVHYDNAENAAIVYSSRDSVFENVTTSGTLTWDSGNNGAFTTYPFANLTMTNCVNEATLQTTTGDTTNYCAVFSGYALGTGTFKMENCVNKGSLICGKASMFLGNWAYSTRVDFVITNCKNNGVIRSMSAGYYGGAGSYNYCTSDYWDKAHCLSFTFDDGIKYTSKTTKKWYDVDVQGSLIGTGTFEYGPFDNALALTQNADGTFTITPASVTADRYVVSVGTYYGLPNGSCRDYVTETVTGTTTTIKAFGFVSQKWVDAHPDAVSGTLNGFTTYTLDGVTYYLISDPDATDISPRGPEMISVSAFNGETLVASAPLKVE